MGALWTDRVKMPKTGANFRWEIGFWKRATNSKELGRQVGISDIFFFFFYFF
jgi:hypothetical protein